MVRMASLLVQFTVMQWIHFIGYAYVYDVPYEQYYLSSNITRSFTVNGCKINEWIGTCSVGLFGYQHVTTVHCSGDNIYRMHGINHFGELNMINIAGEDVHFTVNNSNTFTNDTLSTIGDYVWFSSGLVLDINITGAIYLFGCNTTLTAVDNKHGVQAAKHIYNIMPYRVYHIVSDSHLVHDPHINNGTSYAFDVTFSTKTLIDPPYVLVINCDNATFVANHFHPWNALYLPLTKGEIYFIDKYYRKTLGQATVGYPRWVSATLRYNEKFVTQKYTNGNVDKLINALDINQTKCANPLIFAVTNFEVNSTIGIPNFVDDVNDIMQITPTRIISIVVAH